MQGEYVVHVPPLELSSVHLAHVEPLVADVDGFDLQSDGLQGFDHEDAADEHELVLEAESSRLGDDGVGQTSVEFVESPVVDPVSAEPFSHEAVIIQLAHAEGVSGGSDIENSAAAPEEFLYSACHLHGPEVPDR